MFTGFDEIHCNKNFSFANLEDKIVWIPRKRKRVDC